MTGESGPNEPAIVSDRELIERAIAQDRPALEALVQRYTPLVMGLLYSRVPHHVEDVYQETFASALAELPRLRDKDRFGPWLVKIAKHAAARRARWESRHGGERLEDETQRKIREGCHRAHSSDDDAPGAHPALEEQAQAAIDAILALPERYRLVLYLALVHDQNLQSIGQALGLGPSTVKMRRRRDREKLRKSLIKNDLGDQGSGGTFICDADGTNRLYLVRKSIFLSNAGHDLHGPKQRERFQRTFGLGGRGDRIVRLGAHSSARTLHSQFVGFYVSSLS